MKFTVQMLPPDYLDTDAWPQVSYLFYVEGETPGLAVSEARCQAVAQYQETIDADDWYVQFVFKGHLEPEYDIDI
jgi:hypothetical protein